MTQEELEIQVKDWIEQEEFEKIECFVLDSIVEHYLRKKRR